jgi:hypothetical protein
MLKRIAGESRYHFRVDGVAVNKSKATAALCEPNRMNGGVTSRANVQ